MPSRTKEELEQIRDDFVLIKELWDEKLEWKFSLPNPFDDRSRVEELNDFWNDKIGALKDLLDSGEIKSCEGLTWINKAIRDSNHHKENTSWLGYYGGVNTGSSSIQKIEGGDLTIDGVVKLLEEDPFNERLNQNLNKIGMDACQPIALFELDLENIKLADRDISSNNCLPKSNNKPPFNQI